jgi:hypothetical protein
MSSNAKKSLSRKGKFLLMNPFLKDDHKSLAFNALKWQIDEM